MRYISSEAVALDSHCARWYAALCRRRQTQAPLPPCVSTRAGYVSSRNVRILPVSAGNGLFTDIL
jgi:hypothetical protein